MLGQPEATVDSLTCCAGPRAFDLHEQEPQAAHVVISYGLWQCAMAGDPGIVGRTMRLRHCYVRVRWSTDSRLE